MALISKYEPSAKVAVDAYAALIGQACGGRKPPSSEQFAQQVKTAGIKLEARRKMIRARQEAKARSHRRAGDIGEDPNKPGTVGNNEGPSPVRNVVVNVNLL